MAQTVQEAFANAAHAIRQFTLALGLDSRPRTLLEAWEHKMDPHLFDQRGLTRRKGRRARNMALLKMIGGILQFLFWIFVLVGVVVTIGIIAVYPVAGVILGACIVAGTANAIYRHKKG